MRAVSIGVLYFIVAQAIGEFVFDTATWSVFYGTVIGIVYMALQEKV